MILSMLRIYQSRFCVIAGFVLIPAIASTITLNPTARAGSADEGWSLEAACGDECPLTDLYGNLVQSPGMGGVAIPDETTYSMTRLLSRTGSACVDISLDSPADDVVTFDGVAEAIRTDVKGTTATVVETETDNDDGTFTLVMNMNAPIGRDLFPGGITDLSGNPLTDGCVFLGVFDPLEWPGLDSVTEASIKFKKDGQLLFEDTDILDLFENPSPWDGVLRVSLVNGSGDGINQVEIRIKVEKSPEGQAACCASNLCDLKVLSQCDDLNGVFHPFAVCARIPEAPTPVCNQTLCNFSNGEPLDNAGAPRSQFTPDTGAVFAAADDFMLRDITENPCTIDEIVVWTQHSGFTGGGINPINDYEGVNVTVYKDSATNQPAGRPVAGGGHSEDGEGTIVFAHTIPMSAISAVEETTNTCADELWKLTIPVEMILTKNVRYWLEIQPIMPASKGQVFIALSQNSLEGQGKGITVPGSGWQTVVGNNNVCGVILTPQTRRDLAFQLIGSKFFTPPNNNCPTPITLTDGITPISTVSATTDGTPICPSGTDTTIQNDVWFEHTATCEGTLSIALCGSDFDTNMAVYNGCNICPPSSTGVQCSNDDCVNHSRADFFTQENTCYTIRIGGYLGDQGDGVIDISCAALTGACCVNDQCTSTSEEQPCLNLGGTWTVGQTCPGFSCILIADECVDAVTVQTNDPYDGNTVGTTGTNLSSCGGDNDTHDVWHKWTATCTGGATFSLCNSAPNFDTTLSVYDSCGGTEFVCGDDECGSAFLQSNKIMSVTQGEDYIIRISGAGNAVGDYTLLVTGCLPACCRGSTCEYRTSVNCGGLGGTSFPNTRCFGVEEFNEDDGLCGNPCPPANIQVANCSPKGGTIDARQPHGLNATTPRFGIGSDTEPIEIQLDSVVTPADSCFTLCETAPDPVVGPNSIISVTALPQGRYRLFLNHAIAVGETTVIKYLGANNAVTYYSHPANADGDNFASANDIISLINILNGVLAPPHGLYSSDPDRSGSAGAPDIIRLIDLLNGAAAFDPWLGVARSPDLCP